jgi:hypothetical protein
LAARSVTAAARHLPAYRRTNEERGQGHE